MVSIKVSEYKQIYTSKTALPWDRSNLITISIMNFNPPKEAYKSKKKINLKSKALTKGIRLCGVIIMLIKCVRKISIFL